MNPLNYMRLHDHSSRNPRQHWTNASNGKIKRRGSWSGKRIGGKKWTPAMTLPQIRQGIAVILREALQCGTLAHMLEERQKRLRRNELARFYPWKRLNQLAPLNLHKRLF